MYLLLTDVISVTMCLLLTDVVDGPMCRLLTDVIDVPMCLLLTDVIGVPICLLLKDIDVLMCLFAVYRCHRRIFRTQEGEWKTLRKLDEKRRRKKRKRATRFVISRRVTRNLREPFGPFCTHSFSTPGNLGPVRRGQLSIGRDGDSNCASHA